MRERFLPIVRATQARIEAPDGSMPAFLAEPDAGEPCSGVLIFMEAFGLVPSIESVACRLAREGYTALVPDLFYREIPNNTAAYDDIPRAMELMGKLVQSGDRFLRDVDAALTYLERMDAVRPSRLGVVGFCMGGALAFATACAFSDRIRAAAPFYGGGIVNLLNQAERITCPLYLFFGERDSFIPLDEVHRIETKLSELGKDFRVKIYPGANHGFFNEERRDGYHPEAAADAWNEVLDFFHANLGDVPW